ncbi:DUF2982 domain-containing protein [Alkalimonas sp. MEB108]|uniref:DUF2982 domain-containing protein n=1 Tax=Alkalimonas cellulosilytica TaxID=3058395 RepID=A0ABU7J1G6_9GAMM|nr:DUF2982 domain-containing protein [Alkalimonas sp. MEB108]MEE1999872.1 DUF2982 domain-containing protein [Alkalimonas sp. MEB108]
MSQQAETAATVKAYKASGNEGGAKTMLVSGAIFVLLVLYSWLFVEQANPMLAICFIAASIGIYTGWAKLAEPLHGIVCDDSGVRYHHKRGSWLLPWQAFSHCSPQPDLEHEVNYIAFKVTDMHAFLQHLPLRLAIKLMMEQRALWFAVLKEKCPQGQCATEWLAEKDRFSTPQKQYDGVLAMFANRMQKLGQFAGFELFIPVNCIDVPAEQFCKEVNLMRLQQLNADS